MWIFAGLYAVSAVLALFLTMPEELEQGTLGWSGIGEAAFGTSACLLAHPPAMAALRDQKDIDLVLFDLGGTIYDDSTYTRALLRAVHEIDPNVQDHEPPRPGPGPAAFPRGPWVWQPRGRGRRRDPRGVDAGRLSRSSVPGYPAGEPRRPGSRGAPARYEKRESCRSRPRLAWRAQVGYGGGVRVRIAEP